MVVANDVCSFEAFERGIGYLCKTSQNVHGMHQCQISHLIPQSCSSWNRGSLERFVFVVKPHFASDTGSDGVVVAALILYQSRMTLPSLLPGCVLRSTR